MEGEAQRPRNSSASSPEFEFWMVRNPSSTPPELLTADELIVDGVLLPLHLLSLHHSYPSTQTLPDTSPPPPPLPPADPPPDSILAPTSSAAPPASGSRRWMDIFRAAGDKKPEEKEKERRDRRRNASGFASGDLNFNLNIWPFSRSHSAGTTAGNAAGRLRSIASRKVSSAPCSRSNSRGESSIGGCAGRRWTSSPARGGVHLGRSSPVWKLRRTGMGTKDMSRNSNAAACSAHGGGGVRLINLNVNSCIGYQNQVTCRDDDSDGVAAGGSRTAEGGRSNAGSIFRLRALFSKKVY
ncbi:hypothetical protein KSP39_PZI017180 [Platanthera zijinensis]|uniref:Uncharacterized protein n=1 Tax=Platanthera zijinensis TaxID=2320716 RepID=A0AAP0B5C5_9ASPA